jgi:cytochrome P450/NADPH-cytochrome P450 reductase
MPAAAAAAGGGQPQLPKAGAVLFVTSTYNGEPPDNAVCFAKWMAGAAAAAAGAAAAAAGAAAGLPYAVLGVGNSQWATYQSFPR